MTQKLKQIIKEELEKLPEDTANAINSIDWVKITEEIAEKYFLNENETTNFQTETLLTLCSIEPVYAYIENIEKNVGTSNYAAKQIAEETQQRIFEKINEVYERNINKKLITKNPNHTQNVNFILSGGNYSVFVENKKSEI